MSTYDPVSTATALAENYVYARQNQLDVASKNAQTQTSALTTLKSSLTTFSSALYALGGSGSVVTNKATVSAEKAAAATVSASASEGNYSFQVVSLATTQQSLYDVAALNFQPVAGEENMVQLPQASQLAISIGDDGVVYAVDLSAADMDGDQKLSVTEIARAINTAAEGRVTAAVMTNADGKQQLLLNGTQTGSQGAFRMVGIDGANVTATRDLATAQDAHIKVGGANGLDVYQSSNTYTGIAGLSVEFKAATTEPVTVTVAKDESATKAKMQSFVDAYNSLLKSLDKLTVSGNAELGTASGPLAGDASVRGIRNKLNSLLRMSVDGESLTSFGISAQRDGSIALDADRFAKKVASKPEALADLLGATNTLEYKRTGVLGGMQTYVETWTKTTGGFLQSRQDGLQKQQTSFSKQQSSIDALYEKAYQRYLQQFTALSNLESQMSNTSSLLTSLFSSNKS